MPKRFSTVRGREFGAGLRVAVEASGLSSRTIAEVLDWDESKLSNVVNGKGGATLLEVALLLGVCRAGPAEQSHLLALYAATHEKGWWQGHGRCVPVVRRTAVENLKVAKTLECWQTHVVPLLLQTVDYMSAVLNASSTVPADELQDRVQAQLAMQEELRRNLVKCTFFIHESALHLRVGGAEVHAGQVFHLLLMANWSNIEVRILPATLGAHAGLAGPFTALTFVKHPSLVWVETDNSSLFVEDDRAIAAYGSILGQLEKTSLTADESKTLLARLHEELETSGEEGAGSSPSAFS